MENIVNGIWKVRVGTPESATPLQFREYPISAAELDKLPAIGRPPFTPTDISFTKTSRGCTITLPLNKREQIYGLGLQLKSHNQRGKKKTMRVNSDPIADTGDSHAPVPFYVSTAGYGVYVDTARYVSFYCGTHNKTRGHTELPKETHQSQIADNTADLYKLKDAKGNREMVIDVPAAEGVDLYIFAGPTLRNAVQRYNLFAGGGCLPPMWGLGVWYRAYGKADQEQATATARYLREARMPCDVFGLEPGWQSQAYSCSWTWAAGRFPDPQAFQDWMDKNEFKINLWEHVFVHPTAPVYDELAKFSGNHEVWGGLVPDLTVSQAKEIVADYHKSAFVDRGISGFKLDECDNSDFIRSPWSFPEFTSFPSGLDGEQMHSLLGILYQHTIMQPYQRKNMRTYGQVRSSHALASPLPFVLYSDLYDHRDFVRGVVNMGFSGLLWSPEVRQCNSVEDLIRRIQSVIFSPLAIIDTWMIKNPPWYHYDRDKNNQGERLPEYKTIEDQCRKLFQLRMRLIPYLYSSFAKYAWEGIPPFRALVMDYPEDERTYPIDNAYMMGDSLLVAPLVTGERNRKVYLPKGNWYGLWDRIKYAGESEYEISAGMEEIPVFVKENSLLPLAEPVEFVGLETCFDITVYAFGDKCESIELLEDDGITFNYKNGQYGKVTLWMDDQRDLQSERSGHYSGRRYRIIGSETIKD